MAMQLHVTLVREVARHQADTSSTMVVEEDISGRYAEVNRSTLYCEALSLYLELSREGMARARKGEPLRVSSTCVS